MARNSPPSLHLLFESKDSSAIKTLGLCYYKKNQSKTALLSSAAFAIFFALGNGFLGHGTFWTSRDFKENDDKNNKNPLKNDKNGKKNFWTEEAPNNCPDTRESGGARGLFVKRVGGLFGVATVGPKPMEIGITFFGSAAGRGGCENNSGVFSGEEDDESEAPKAGPRKEIKGKWEFSVGEFEEGKSGRRIKSVCCDFFDEFLFIFVFNVISLIFIFFCLFLFYNLFPIFVCFCFFIRLFYPVFPLCIFNLFFCFFSLSLGFSV